MTLSTNDTADIHPPDAPPSRDVPLAIFTIITAAVVAVAVARLDLAGVVDTATEEAASHVRFEAAPAQLQIRQRLDELELRWQGFESQLAEMNRDLQEKGQQLEATLTSLQAVMDGVTNTTQTLRKELAAQRQQARTDLDVSMKTLEESLKALAANEKVGSEIAGAVANIKPKLDALPDGATLGMMKQEVALLRSELDQLRAQISGRSGRPGAAAVPPGSDLPPPTVVDPPPEEDDYMQRVREKLESQ